MYRKPEFLAFYREEKTYFSADSLIFLVYYPKIPIGFAIKCQKVLAKCAKQWYYNRAIL